MPKSCIPDMSSRVIDGGRIQLLDAVGRGSFGTVYCAQDLASSIPELLAVKVVPKLRGNPTRQWKEIMLHKTVCDHKNVVTLRRVIHDEGYIYIVMDFCPSGDLWDAVREGLYWRNDALVRGVFLQLIDALESCHQQGIYHRDLKPNNILVNKDGTEVFLTDFGLASKGKQSTSFGVGTHQFRSPECNNDSRNYKFFDAERNDIWALGVIFANVLSGKLPWGRASEDDESYARHLRHPHHLRHILPISLEANYILQRIFHTGVEFAPSLDDVREMILRVRTFFMDDEEISRNPSLQKVVEQFRAASPLPATTLEDISRSDDSDDSLLDDSDDSDEHSIGLHSPSLIAMEEGRLGERSSGHSCFNMLLGDSPTTSLLATPLVGGVDVERSALLTPSQPQLSPEQANKQTSSATLVTSDRWMDAEKGRTWISLSRSMKRLFGGSARAI